jgi:division protein CdvB (Snf7/Vps24/ESCRT-III family)
MNTPEIVYDFDEWKSLHQNDPEKFEQLKNAYIAQEIKKLSDGDLEVEKRYKNIHYGINMQLDKIKNPISRLAKMEQLLHASLFKLNDALHGIVPEQTPGTIIPFKKPQNN